MEAITQYFLLLEAQTQRSNLRIFTRRCHGVLELSKTWPPEDNDKELRQPDLQRFYFAVSVAYLAAAVTWNGTESLTGLGHAH